MSDQPDAIQRALANAIRKCKKRGSLVAGLRLTSILHSYDPAWGAQYDQVLAEEATQMSSNAIVDCVHFNEDGSGRLALSGEKLDQPELHYDWAPFDVTALNGRPIQIGSAYITCGDVQIAVRVRRTKIKFIVEDFMRAILSLEDATTPA